MNAICNNNGKNSSIMFLLCYNFFLHNYGKNNIEANVKILQFLIIHYDFFVNHCQISFCFIARYWFRMIQQSASITSKVLAATFSLKVILHNHVMTETDLILIRTSPIWIFCAIANFFVRFPSKYPLAILFESRLRYPPSISCHYQIQLQNIIPYGFLRLE